MEGHAAILPPPKRLVKERSQHAPRCQDRGVWPAPFWRVSRPSARLPPAIPAEVPMRRIGLGGSFSRASSLVQFTAEGQYDERGRPATFDTTDMQGSTRPCRHKRTV